MTARTLIAILTLPVAAAVVTAGTMEIAHHLFAQERVSHPQPDGIAGPAAGSGIPTAPEIVEPEPPVLREAVLPTEPLVRPVLQPVTPPAPVHGIPRYRGLLAVLRSANEIVVPVAPAPVRAPRSPILAAEPDLRERLVVPELASAEPGAPATAGPKACCLARSHGSVGMGPAGC